MSSSTLSSHSRTILIETGSESHSQLHPQSQQSVINQSTNQEDLKKLKLSLEMTKQELIQLTNTNQFSDKVFCFNNEAKKLIQANKIQQALLYLNEAQKILEYAASCGKNIERKRIVEVLHNQACSYQILWDLEKCSNYIEALIFNFNSELKFGEFPNSVNPSEIHMSSSKKSVSSQSRIEAQNKIEAQKIQKKVHLVKYYLLYCAINSQLKNNQGALVAAKKASEISKNLIQQLLDIFEEQKQANHSFTQSLPPFLYPMLQQIPKMVTSISTRQTDELLTLVRHYIKVYNSKCIFNNLSSSKGFQSGNNTKEIYQKYKDFSIGNIMQLQPIGDNSDSQKSVIEGDQPSHRIHYGKLIEKIIVFSICHFTMATELRYIALNNAKNEKEKSHSMIQFKESETYHLLSVLIIAMYMPFDIVYMENIISSYHGHYKTVLLSNGLDEVQGLSEMQICRIKQNVLFWQGEKLGTSTSGKKQDDLKKCSTTNQSNSSLIVSFHEEDLSQHMQESNKKSLKKSLKKLQKKSSHAKNTKPHNYSFVNHEQDISDEQRRMFDEYYYVKKDTEQDSGRLAYDQTFGVNKQPSVMIKSVKSKSKAKKSLSKINCKKKSIGNSKSRSKIQIEQSIEQADKENMPTKRQPRQNQFRPQPSVWFEAKASTLILPSQHSKDTKFTSQRTSHGIHSPMIVPQIYSKITKSKQSKSRQTKKKVQNKTQTIKHQSEYFNKCNLGKKNDLNRPSKPKQNLKSGKENKWKSAKKTLDTKKQDTIKTEYFHVHDMNVVRENTGANRKNANNQGFRKSVSKGKKQRLSSKSLTKALSPNALASKHSNNRLGPQMSKQKRMRHTQGLGSIYVRSGNGTNRRSVSNKKTERMTMHKQTNRLATEESGMTMKGSRFNNYYL